MAPRKGTKGGVTVAQLTQLAKSIEDNREAVVDLFEKIKSQIPKAGAPLATYSSVLFKAWKGSSGGGRLQFEATLQEFMQLAITSDLVIAAKCRAVLQEFHTKRDAAVDELLPRLYEPILWRHLVVANWKVRYNATALLAVAFPLVPPDLGVQEHEAELSRACHAFSELMRDEHEVVRKMAVEATCRVLSMFWEALPAEVSSSFLNTLSTVSVRDKSNAGVRISVVSGINVVLLNPASHGVMKPILKAVVPRALNDTSVAVRLHCAKLLVTMSCMKDVSCFDVVSSEALLSQLCKECALARVERAVTRVGGKGAGKPKRTGSATAQEEAVTSAHVAQTLAGLLSKAILNEKLPEQLQRCSFLSQEHPLALIALLGENALPENPRERAKAVADELRLAVALFDTAVRKCRDSSSTEGHEDEGQTGTNQWPPVRVGVFFQCVRDILSHVFQEGKSSATLDDKLQKFLLEHFKEEAFLSLFQGPHRDVSMQILAKLDLPQSNYTTVRGAIKSQFLHLATPCAGNGPGGGAFIPLCMKWGLIEDGIARCFTTIDTMLTKLNDDANTAITSVADEVEPACPGTGCVSTKKRRVRWAGGKTKGRAANETDENVRCNGDFTSHSARHAEPLVASGVQQSAIKTLSTILACPKSRDVLLALDPVGLRGRIDTFCNLAIAALSAPEFQAPRIPWSLIGSPPPAGSEEEEGEASAPLSSRRCALLPCLLPLFLKLGLHMELRCKTKEKESQREGAVCFSGRFLEIGELLAASQVSAKVGPLQPEDDVPPPPPPTADAPPEEEGKAGTKKGRGGKKGKKGADPSDDAPPGGKGDTTTDEKNSRDLWVLSCTAVDKIYSTYLGFVTPCAFLGVSQAVPLSSDSLKNRQAAWSFLEASVRTGSSK